MPKGHNRAGGTALAGPPARFGSVETSPQNPPLNLPPGPRARIVRGIGEGIAAADAGASYSAIPYARDVYPLTRAAWSLGYTARRAQLDPASRPSTLSAALDPADESGAVDPG